jgi:hypothetical protein
MMASSLQASEPVPNLLAISDQEQAEHSLEDKQKAVQQEFAFLVRDFKKSGQLQSAVFVQQSLQVCLVATETLLKNKLNFDAAKRQQQQGHLSEADQEFLSKRLNQTLSSVHRGWLKPTLSRHCQETENTSRLPEALSHLEQRLQALKAEFPAWVAAKIATG